ANGFNPENSNLSPFMQRLARAHANCLEGLPVFGGLMLLAVVADRATVTDPLAWVLLAARVVQSLIHLASTSPVAVTARFTAFGVQMGIAVYWVWGLALALRV
ncbi:MAG: MAPEG family protein, partial [Rhodoferax sp.]|nr:MAPEG family protein [Rhodoferax sp.]